MESHIQSQKSVSNCLGNGVVSHCLILNNICNCVVLQYGYDTCLGFFVSGGLNFQFSCSIGN